MYARSSSHSASLREGRVRRRRMWLNEGEEEDDDCEDALPPFGASTV